MDKSNPLDLHDGDRVTIRGFGEGIAHFRRQAVVANLSQEMDGNSVSWVDSGPGRMFDGRQYGIMVKYQGRDSLIFAYPHEITKTA